MNFGGFEKSSSGTEITDYCRMSVGWIEDHVRDGKVVKPEEEVKPNGAGPESLQSTEASVNRTSTSNTNGAGITLAPIAVPVNGNGAVGNGQATVTVTVTVSTT